MDKHLEQMAKIIKRVQALGKPKNQNDLNHIWKLLTEIDHHNKMVKIKAMVG